MNESIADSDQSCFFSVASQNVTETDFTRRKPNGGARNGRFAEIERRAIATDAAANHHESIFGLAQRLMGRDVQRAKKICNTIRLRMDKHRHRLAADLFGAF